MKRAASETRRLHHGWKACRLAAFLESDQGKCPEDQLLNVPSLPTTALCKFLIPGMLVDEGFRART